MNGTARLALAAAGGAAAAMYFLDPVTGKRRRAMVRDKSIHLSRTSGKFAEKAARDIGNRVRGLGVAARSVLSHPDVGDEVLVDRVHARLGRLTTHPGAIEVSAEQGVVLLSGPVLKAEKKRVLAGVRGIPGVCALLDRLEEHEQPGDVPGLQGGSGRRIENRWEIMQTNWSPATRLAAGVTGGLLAIYGLRCHGASAALATTAGAGLLLRGVLNREMKALTGIGAGRGCVSIQKTVNIHAPIERVFDFWSHVENFARFMSHVLEVEDRGQGRSHWRVAGRGGITMQWDAQVTGYEKNRMLAWRSDSGSGIGHSGVVNFRPAHDGSTQVNLRVSYSPPAGAIGHTVASLFGADLKTLLDEDMVRLKSLLEEGKATGRHRQVTLDELQPAPSM